MKIKLNLDRKIFNDAYYPLLNNYSNKFEIYYGGSWLGSGKSVFVAQKLIVKSLREKRRVLVNRKVGASLKESCFKLIKDILSNWNILEYSNINKTDLTIELPNGSIFLFKGLDDPEKIKSIVGITDCWCEECTELNQEDFDQ